MDDNILERTNACAALDPADREALWEAATKMLDASNIVIKLAEQLGDATSWVGGKLAGRFKQLFGVDVAEKIDATLHDLLWSFQSGAMTGLDGDGTGDRWSWLHKALVVASGGSGGFFGLPGLLWDLPITTTLIMRSVADIARSFPGEDISSDDTKRACIEVFALGSPLAEDDEADFGYWTARVGLSHKAIEVFIRSVAGRYGVVVSEKLVAQSVPIAGAAAGATLNYAFIGYYQEMARVHFAIGGVERRASDASAVRPCFSAIIREIQERRRHGHRKANG
jgi:hypothetical protein